MRRQKYEKLNNEVLPNVAHDKQARIGCKGGSKFWYGYKKHGSVDMQSGLINKVAVTPANVTDAKGMAHVLPNGGATYAEKVIALLQLGWLHPVKEFIYVLLRKIT